jgi:hypothetical protein
MLVYEVQRLVFRNREDYLGTFETVGYIRRDYYSNNAARQMAESIRGIWRLVEGHGVDFRLVTWDHAHEEGDSVTSWAWRVRSW